MTTHTHTKLAGVKAREAIHLHYKDDDSVPSRHPLKRKKNERRRAGAGSSRSFSKIPRITVRQIKKTDGTIEWAICHNGSVFSLKKSKEAALAQAREDRESYKRLMRK
jgi:hypothetical protein